MKKKKRRKQDLPEQAGAIALMCGPCHRMIHAVLSERELETKFGSVSLLLAHPEIATFVTWVAKQDPARQITVRWTTDRRASKRR